MWLRIRGLGSSRTQTSRMKPTYREIAEYLYEVCYTKTEDYAVSEIERHLCLALADGARSAGMEKK